MSIPAPASEAVTQFAVLDALLAGSYGSGMPLGDVRRAGDFGVGCCDRLGGEVVILDGVAYECTVDGGAAVMDDAASLPFVDVCRFPEVPPSPLEGADLAGLTARVEAELVSRNLFHAIRIDGVFARLRTRVTPRQTTFRPLAEATREQVETVRTRARGSLVGFWSPLLYQGITVAGLHLHYISEDRAGGGHVLDVSVDSAELRIASFACLDLRLPTDELFLGTELGHEQDRGIATVEGGAPAASGAQQGE